MTLATYGSIFMAYATGGRGSARHSSEPCVQVAPAGAVSTGGGPAVGRSHKHLAKAGIPVCRRGAAARGSGRGGRYQDRFYGQVAPVAGGTATPIRRSDRPNAGQHCQPGPMDIFPARGSWLSAGRQPIECSWNIVLIACSWTSFGKPTSYSCPNGGASFPTIAQR